MAQAPRPTLDATELGLLVSPIPRWDHAAVEMVLDREFGLRGALSALPSERDQNLRVESTRGRFVVKIANAAEDRRTLDFQEAVLEHLGRVPGALLVPAVRPAVDGRGCVQVEHEGAPYLVRVLTYLDGVPLRDEAVPPYDVGCAVAQLQRSLQGFFHTGAGRRILWDLRRIADLRPLVGSIEDPDLRGRVARIIDRVEAEVVPQLDRLAAQVVHNDMNPDNLLVTGERITGVVDFGDMVHGPRVMDLAVAASYQIQGGLDPEATLDDVCRGYQSVTRLTAAELTVVPDLVAARLCQSIVIGSWRASLHPENAPYLLADVAPAAATLTRLTSAESPPRRRSAPTSDLVTRRQRVLAPGLRLSYDHPLHLVSGDGVWVRDAAGRRYLDAYNNVVQIGHGHPAVARALQLQTRRLNTNTRYLVEEIVDYAERLTALLPDGLDTCYFTNSGSEANDLAVRIARTVTGNQGVVITENAYHGSTNLLIAMSPEELGGGGLESWVATMPGPGPDATSSAEEAVAALRRTGHAPAALVFDTIFSSDGIHDPSAGYLDSAAATVRAAGGLFIADEVQAGLGRVGPRLWGFAAGAVVPDIVTLGKPIGNGHPLGAVVMTPDIAARFAEKGYYFSTFGGNPVAAAAGSAVLDITLADALPDRAGRVGEYLRSSLDDLGFEVHGAGLFIGVELADAGAAREAVEAMREGGVLIGRTGRGGNVLKIRPPLVFEEDHADLLLSVLAEVT